jgi:hydroxymethylpyrimidine pyrophosphatase-like HAD family hydrolase
MLTGTNSTWHHAVIVSSPVLRLSSLALRTRQRTPSPKPTTLNQATPPKHGVREAIGTLRLAGIKVMMVTGDHPKTAEAIARKINLVIGDTKATLARRTGKRVEEIYEDEVDAVVVHGDEIDGLEGWQWDNSKSPYFVCDSRIQG